MTAHVVKGTKLAVISSHYNQRLTRQLGCHEGSRLLQLFGTSHRLPCLTEHFLAFQLRNAFIHIPGRGNGVSVVERSTLVVARQNFVKRGCHSVNSERRS